jgi:hypothetical protein
MFRIVIVILMYLRHKLTDPSNLLGSVKVRTSRLDGRLGFRRTPVYETG